MEKVGYMDLVNDQKVFIWFSVEDVASLACFISFIHMIRFSNDLVSFVVS